MKNKSYLVFTDLDGTLLDHDNYSFEKALPGIAHLDKRNIPWLFNTSKTFAELKQLRQEVGNPWPMIVENGGGVAVPQNSGCDRFFSGNAESTMADPVEIDDFKFFTLGRRREDFVELVANMQAEFNFVPYSQMSTEYLAEVTGLSMDKAAQSLDRQFTEPCLWQDSDKALKEFTHRLKPFDLTCVRGGRFAHVMGKSDKGSALNWVVSNLYSGSSVHSIALGDGENDLAMLNQADIAVLVRSPQHDPPGPCKAAQAITTQAVGPEGWAGAIIALT